VIDWLIERAEARDLAGNAAAGLRSVADGDPWKSALPIFTQVNQGRAVSGYTKLKPLKSFNTPSSRVDYRDEIYRELVRGRIVIVDLHLGPDATIRQLSENLAGHLMERQTGRSPRETSLRSSGGTGGSPQPVLRREVQGRPRRVGEDGQAGRQAQDRDAVRDPGGHRRRPQVLANTRTGWSPT
jgi:hypothetical protein